MISAISLIVGVLDAISLGTFIAFALSRHARQMPARVRAAVTAAYLVIILASILAFAEMSATGRL